MSGAGGSGRAAPLCHDGPVTLCCGTAGEPEDHEPAEPVTVEGDGKPREACGVFAVYAPGQPVAHLAYLGIYALQHRGQESAGIATSNGEHLTVVKDMGLVSNVFDDRTLAALYGDLAIGHTRYSTTGSSMWKNSQPVFRNVGGVEFDGLASVASFGTDLVRARSGNDRFASVRQCRRQNRRGERDRRCPDPEAGLRSTAWQRNRVQAAH